MAKLVYLKDVVTLALDKEKCVKCGMCLIVCPHAVFSMNERHAYIGNRDACMECGACAQNCPEGAILVNAGVGCATAVIQGALKGTEPCCDCGGSTEVKESGCC